MSISPSRPDPTLCAATGEAAHVPAGPGITKWLSGVTCTMKLTSQLTNGSLGLIEASVPPDVRPVAHTHAHEIRYLIPAIPEGCGACSTGGDGRRTRDVHAIG